jgi:diguanylate cyclase (GGDEF)-like protein/PAS domain S-box-containing protein
MTSPISNIHGRTILIVDDTPANLAVAVEYLEDNSFRVIVAQDGEECLERAQLVLPDLILLDVMMPGIDGFETCRRLKSIQSTREIPVIFMTALADTRDKLMAFAAGAVDYVSKPFQVEELLARIKTHLTLRAMQQQLAKQNEELRASEIRYHRLFETAKDGILLLDFESGLVTDVNVAAVEMLGYSRDHYLSKKLCEVQPFKDVLECETAFTELQVRENVSFAHWPLAAKDKSLVDVEFVSNSYDVNGSKMVQCNIRDITSRIQDQARITFMALHDALTGLPNRILLRDRLGQSITLASRNRKRVGVLMLDLDHFKDVNDSLGHQIGDGLLEAVASRLKDCLRESDIVSRLGGDEFVIVLPDVSGESDIGEVVQKLLKSLHEPFHVDGHQLVVGCSIGIGKYPDDGETPGALLRVADIAMYAAKSTLRGSYKFFTPELNMLTQRRILLVADLHQACARGEIALYYQPQVSMISGAITGVEALMRWNHPKHGIVSPDEFIPLLEEMGMMVVVGRWALKTACLQSMAWQKEGLTPVRMSVNVSAQQFYRGDLPRMVEEVLRESGLESKWLELELTETLSLDDSETTINIMKRLKLLGVSLSLDDFGTGWSSLSYLRRFPLDRLKIDRSFMRDIPLQARAEAVVTSILDLAQNLGFTTIAEGVETPEQLDYLDSKNCEEIQGFIYSPPLSAEDCSALMRSGNSSFKPCIKGSLQKTDQIVT